MRRASAALAALASLTPAIASACPYCAGRSGGTVGTGIVLGAFVLLPFLVAFVIYRVMRAEARAGDATLFEVTDPGVVDRPVRAPAPKAGLGALSLWGTPESVPRRFLPHGSRREAE